MLNLLSSNLPLICTGLATIFAILLYVEIKRVGPALIAWGRTYLQEHRLGVLEIEIEKYIVLAEKSMSQLTGPGKMRWVLSMLAKAGFVTTEAAVELVYQRLNSFKIFFPEFDEVLSAKDEPVDTGVDPVHESTLTYTNPRAYRIDLTQAEVDALDAFRECTAQLAHDAGDLAEGTEVKEIFDAVHSVWGIIDGLKARK